MAIVVRSVRPKELIIEPTAAGGTTTRELTPQEGRRPVLDDAEVLALAELGVTIEREYGSPQDTEWAFDSDGTIWMLQSRPITTTATTPAASASAPSSAEQGTGRRPRPGCRTGAATGVARLLRSMADAAKLQTAMSWSRT